MSIKDSLVSGFLLTISIFLGILGIVGIIKGIQGMFHFGFSIGSLIDYGGEALFGILILLFARFLYRKAPIKVPDPTSIFLLAISILLGMLGIVRIIKSLQTLFSYRFSYGALIDEGPGVLFGILLLFLARFLYRKAPIKIPVPTSIIRGTKWKRVGILVVIGVMLYLIAGLIVWLLETFGIIE